MYITKSFYQLLIGFYAFATCCTPCSGQAILEQGTVTYRLMGGNSDSKDIPTFLTVHFKPGWSDAAIASKEEPTEERDIINYDQDSLSTIFYLEPAEDGSGVMIYTRSFTESLDDMAKRYQSKVFADTQTIAGYVCQKFEIRPKGAGEPTSLLISGWATTRIKSRFRPVAELETLFPGFPLDIQVRVADGDPNHVGRFLAERIEPTFPDSAFTLPRAGAPHTSTESTDTVAYKVDLAAGWEFVENNRELFWAVIKNRPLQASIVLDKNTLSNFYAWKDLEKTMHNMIEAKIALYKIQEPEVQRVVFQGVNALRCEYCYVEDARTKCFLHQMFIRRDRQYEFSIEAPEMQFKAAVSTALPMLETLQTVE